MKLRHLVIAVCIMAASLFFSNNANALTVSPPVIDYNLDRGANQKGTIRLLNETIDTLTYSLNVQRFGAGEGEYGEPQIFSEDDKVMNDLKNWITFKQQSVTLNKDESQVVEYEINIPTNAEPGGHYAVAFFGRGTDANGDGSGVGLGAKIGVLFLVNVSGDVKEDAEFLSFNTKNKIVSHLPVEMELRVKNNGTVHFKPKGNITIKNLLGMESAKVSLNPYQNNVLPHSIRRVNAWWVKNQDATKDEGFISGLKNEWFNFGFGYYEATAYMTYGSKNTEMQPMSVTFWVFPWRLTIVFLAILAVLFGGIKLYNKIIVSSALKKQKS